MITLTEENYLKAIFHLISEENTVTVNEISKFLKVKMPSVNNMMKKFADKKWVVYKSYQPIIITETGKKQAALVVRKHRLTEMFLVEKMNFGWENVHEIAEQLEHIQSVEFFDKMDELLHFPKLDPHGEPIPDKEGHIVAPDFKKLCDCKVNDRLIFASVTTSDDDFLTYLNEKKLELGMSLTILKIEKFDKSMEIKCGSKKYTLSPMITEKLLVKPL